MACFSPLTAYRSPELHGSGKAKIVFDKSRSLTGVPLMIPCGQCTGCRLDRSRMWALRCVHESQLHQENSFITLTYNAANLPADGSLNKKHFQDFMKRLRWEYSEKQIRFYHCGEYGPKLSRPHYHALLFNHQFDDLELHSNRKGIKLFRSETLSSIWGKGFVTVGEVNIDSAAYCARYCLKKITGEKASYHYDAFDPHTGEILKPLQPEYSTMSRRPGIARAWYEKFHSDVFPKDYVTHKGKKHRPPRYYDSMFEHTDPEQFEIIKRQRKVKAASQKADSTPQRLKARAECKDIQISQLKRTYETDET